MPERMKIWVVTALFPTKGEPYRGAAIWSTLRELSSYADVECFCPLARYPARLTPRNFRHLAQHAETERYGVRSRTVEYFAIPGATRSLNGKTIYRSLRRSVPPLAPDLILGFYIYPEAYAAVRLGETLDVPVVIGSRGSDLRKIDGAPFVQKMTRSAVQRADAVLCVSSDLAEIAQRLGAAPQKVHTIRNGVDGDVFCPQGQGQARSALNLPVSSQLVLFVGRLSALKGVPQLVDAMARLRSRGSWHLALVGEGSIEWDLRRQVRDLGIQDRVTFVGELTAHEIAAWMNASDFLCLPSESEGCPNVVVEALSCGTPVVATAVGGIPELVNERSAVLMPTNTPAAIAEALEEASRKSWNRGQIARENLRTWKQVAHETYQVCECVVRNRESVAPPMMEASYGTRG